MHFFTMNYERFFDRNVDEVAQDLLGRALVRKTSKGMLGLQISETGAYLGADIDLVNPKPNHPQTGMLYDPGKIFLMPCRGSRLLNIACGDSRDPAACVDIRLLTDLTKSVKGAGSISNFLQIPEELNSMFLGDESGLYITEKFNKGSIKKESGKIKNCRGIYTFA